MFAVPQGPENRDGASAATPRPISTKLKTSTNSSLMRQALRPREEANLMSSFEAPETPQLRAQVADLARLVKVLTEKQEQSSKVQAAQVSEIDALKSNTQLIKAQTLQDVEQKIAAERKATHELMELATKDRSQIKNDLALEKTTHAAQALSIRGLEQTTQAIRAEVLQDVNRKIAEEHEATQKLMELAAKDREQIKKDVAEEKVAQEVQARSIYELKQGALVIKEEVLQGVESKIAEEHAATQALIELAAQDRTEIKKALEAEKAAHEAQGRAITTLEHGAETVKAQVLQEVETRMEAVQSSIQSLEQNTDAKLAMQRAELTQQSVENYILVMNDVQESLLDLNQEVHGFDDSAKAALHNQIDVNTLKQAQEIANVRGATQLIAALEEGVRAMEKARIAAEHDADFVQNVLPGLQDPFGAESDASTVVLGDDNVQD